MKAAIGNGILEKACGLLYGEGRTNNPHNVLEDLVKEVEALREKVGDQRETLAWYDSKKQQWDHLDELKARWQGAQATLVARLTNCMMAMDMAMDKIERSVNESRGFQAMHMAFEVAEEIQRELQMAASDAEKIEEVPALKLRLEAVETVNKQVMAENATMVKLMDELYQDKRVDLRTQARRLALRSILERAGLV